MFAPSRGLFTRGRWWRWRLAGPPLAVAISCRGGNNVNCIESPFSQMNVNRVGEMGRWLSLPRNDCSQVVRTGFMRRKTNTMVAKKMMMMLWVYRPVGSVGGRSRGKGNRVSL